MGGKKKKRRSLSKGIKARKKCEVSTYMCREELNGKYLMTEIGVEI